VAKRRMSVAPIVSGALTVAVYALLMWIVVSDREAFGASEAVHVVGALCLFAIVSVGIAVALASSRSSISAVRQVVAVAVAMLVAAAIVGDPDNYGGQAGPFDLAYMIWLAPPLIFAVVHPARRRVATEHRWNITVLLVAVVIAGPLLMYGLDEALLQRNSWPPKSDPHHNSHWFTMAALSFTMALLALVAAWGGAGRHVAGYAAAAALAIVGVVSAVYPDMPSSFGRGWGVAAVVGAAALAGSLLRMKQHGGNELAAA
jgi:hypothetical protein